MKGTIYLLPLDAYGVTSAHSLALLRWPNPARSLPFRRAVEGGSL